MAKYPTLLLASLLAALATGVAGCSNYSDYQSNMTYVNSEILAQEETLALEQLREARARFEQALRAGAAAPGSEVEKTFMEAREKYLILKKEQALRAGRVLTVKDIADDPELAIPGSPGGSSRKPADPRPAGPEPARDAAPPEDSVSAPENPGQSPSSTAPARDETTYTVQKGDTLGAIARKHRVDVVELAAHNILADQDRIAPGQVLRIPHP